MTTFNTSDPPTHNFTLSNGNLTAVVNTDSVDSYAASNTGKYNGKIMWEQRVNQVTSYFYGTVFADPSLVAASGFLNNAVNWHLAYSGALGGCICQVSATNLFYLSGSTPPTPGIILTAYDIPNDNLWQRVWDVGAGNWWNDGLISQYWNADAGANPATATGGVHPVATGGMVAPTSGNQYLAGIYGFGTGDGGTINFVGPTGTDSAVETALLGAGFNWWDTSSSVTQTRDAREGLSFGTTVVRGGGRTTRWTRNAKNIFIPKRPALVLA